MPKEVSIKDGWNIPYIFPNDINEAEKLLLPTDVLAVVMS